MERLRAQNEGLLKNLLEEKHITQTQHDRWKGLSNERCQFELKLVQEHISQGHTINDETFAEIQKQGIDFAVNLTTQCKRQEEIELENRYSSAVAELQKRKQETTPQGHNLYHVRLHPDDFSREGTENFRPVADFIRESMQKLGFATDALKVRMFSAERVGKAIATGTDRDGNSNTHHVDAVEPTLMRIFGIHSARDVTYVSDLHRWSGPSRINKGLTDAIIVYRGDRLFKIGHEGNGFSTFITNPHDAALVVFSSQGRPLDEILAERPVKQPFGTTPTGMN